MQARRIIECMLVLLVASGIATTVYAQDNESPVLGDSSDDNGEVIGVDLDDYSAQNADTTATACINGGKRVADGYANYQRDIKGDVHAYFYDSNGRPCFVREAARITEGDLFVFGFFGDASDPSKLDVQPVTCAVESPNGRIRDQFIDIGSDDEEQTGLREPKITDPKFFELGKFDCYGNEAKFKLTRASDDADVQEKTINQYERYYATWQVGALWTDLQDRSFTLVDRGMGNVISQDVDGSDGPLYVGSVSVYGFPRYVQSWFGDKRYSGRDIINHNNFLDRVGLNFSFGLEDPTEILGIGLSFELVRGVNLTYSRLYRKIDVLDGPSIGDSFASGDIPTQKSWEDESVIGFAIDGRLISKFFGGGDD